MKKWIILLLTIMVTALVACSTEAPEEDAENETDNTSEETDPEADKQQGDAEEKTTQDDSAEQNDEAGEENTSDNEAAEDKSQTENTEETNNTPINEPDYTVAEHCIMTQLTECENVPEADMFQAYSDLVADGTLPQAPGSGCLPCAVKYSFEVKYGDSKQVNSTILPRSDKMPADIADSSEFVQQYLFALPSFFNNEDEIALRFYLPESPGYHALFANRASGNYSNHMTYSVFIDSVVENPDGSQYIYATREYSHINTDSVYEVYARYQVVEQDERYYLTDYEELENMRVE